MRPTTEGEASSLQLWLSGASNKFLLPVTNTLIAKEPIKRKTHLIYGRHIIRASLSANSTVLKVFLSVTLSKWMTGCLFLYLRVNTIRGECIIGLQDLSFVLGFSVPPFNTSTHVVSMNPSFKQVILLEKTPLILRHAAGVTFQWICLVLSDQWIQMFTGETEDWRQHYICSLLICYWICGTIITGGLFIEWSPVADEGGINIDQWHDSVQSDSLHSLHWSNQSDVFPAFCLLKLPAGQTAQCGSPGPESVQS